MEHMKFNEFARRYCETQQREPDELLQMMQAQADRYPDVTGWLLLQFADMCSSKFGQHAILMYGPSNSIKSLPEPEAILHPYDLASDSASVVGVLSVESMKEAAR